MNKFQFFFKKKTIIIVVIFIAAAGIAISKFYFIQSQKAHNIISSPDLVGGQEARDLANKVSNFILLPEGELPTIATVSDSEQLKDQSFFEKSQNGDKVLIYAEAKKAYLYRPSTDKLIDVTTLNVDTDSAQQSPVAPAGSEPAEMNMFTP